MIKGAIRQWHKASWYVRCVTAAEGRVMTDYRIDELARAADMTVRNVRAYQERGLLPPPRRVGRTGLYDDTHLGRLRLIGRLLDRGYTSAHIADFVRSWEAGDDLGRVLGLEAALLAPGSGEIPAYLTYDELVTMFGSDDPRATERSIELGLLVPEGDRYRVPNPRLLRAGAELVAIGIPLGDVLDLAARLRERVSAVSDDFVATVAGHVIDAHGPGWMPSDAELPALASLVERLRPLARVAVDTELAAALDAAISEFVGRWSSDVLDQLGRSARDAS